MLERLVWAEISLSSFAYNITSIKKLVGKNVKIMAVLKADGYGHGAIKLAKASEKLPVDYLGVACLFEALSLKKAKVSLPILIINYIDVEGAIEAIKNGISITIMDEEVLAAVINYSDNNKIKATIHIKIDTGMHRAGVDPEQAISLIKKAKGSKNIHLEGLFTHFATSDDENEEYFYEQNKIFQQFLQKLVKLKIKIPIVHAANSAATLRYPDAYYGMVRPGIVIYGLSPTGLPPMGEFKYPFEPKPILSLKTIVINIRTVNAGEPVGYSGKYISKRKMRVGLLPAGFGDGFRRGPYNWGNVLIRGKKASVIGRVSMDMSFIDLTDIPESRMGDEVVLIGKQGKESIAAEEVALRLGTNCHEVTCLITPRVQRIYNP